MRARLPLSAYIVAVCLVACGGSGGSGAAPDGVAFEEAIAPFHVDGAYLMPCTPLGFTMERGVSYAAPGGAPQPVEAIAKLAPAARPPAPAVRIEGGPPASAAWRADRVGAAIEIAPAAPLDPETTYTIAVSLDGFRAKGAALSGERTYRIHTLASDAQGTWLFPIHYSQALRRERQMEIYLPPGHGLNPDQLYPTLHGYVGGLSLLDNFRTRDNIDRKLAEKIASCEIEPMIFAVPDPHHLGPFEFIPGNTFFVAGDYTDWDDPTADGREWYETYLTEEFPDFVEGRWRARTDKWGRGTTGYSHGGYGAASLAFRHPDRFGSTLPMSAFMSLRYMGSLPYEPPSEVPYWTDPAQERLSRNDLTNVFLTGMRKSLGLELSAWIAHNPADIAGSLDDGDFDGGILLATAEDDAYEILSHLYDVSRILAERGVRHMTFVTPEGGHTHSFWRQALDRGLPMHSRAFTGRPQPEGALE